MIGRIGLEHSAAQVSCATEYLDDEKLQGPLCAKAFVKAIQSYDSILSRDSVLTVVLLNSCSSKFSQLFFLLI